MMLDMEQRLKLPSAADYAAASGSANLPLVYGNLSDGAGGQWKAVRLDADAGVFGLAGHALAAVAGLYDAEGTAYAASSYTLNLAHDYQGLGTIATVTFGSGGPATVWVAGGGKPGPGGAALDNPVLIAADMVDASGQDGESLVDRAVLTRAANRAAELGLSAGGVITAKQRLGDALTALLGEFLGSWWVGGDGLLKLLLDFGPGTHDELMLADNLHQAELDSVTATAALDDVVNQVELSYRLNHASGDFQAMLDGAELADLLSIGLHGARCRSLELNWVRAASTARVVAARLIDLLGRPRRIVRCRLAGLTRLHLEKGDLVGLSLPWLYDERGRALANQIMRILSVEPQLDQSRTNLSLLDTGMYRTVAAEADGSSPADGSHVAGGSRDRGIY